MTALDVVFILTALAGAFVGARLGAMTSLFSLAGGVAASWGAGRFFQYGVDFLNLSARAAYFSLFVLLGLLFVVIGLFARRVVRIFFMASVDKILGGALGFCLGILLTVAAVTPSLFESAPSTREMMRQSSVARRATQWSQEVFRFLPSPRWKKMKIEWSAQDAKEKIQDLVERARPRD